MYLLPYKRLELRSPLTPVEVARALSESVEPRRWFRFGSGTRPFEGTVSGSEFRIQRIIGYRNSFLPWIHGSIASEASGSRISIAMVLHPVVLVLTVIWFGGIFAMGIEFAVAFIAGRKGIADGLIPVGMFLFGWLLAVGSFSYEARKATRLIISLVRRTDVAR